MSEWVKVAMDLLRPVPLLRSMHLAMNTEAKR